MTRRGTIRNMSRVHNELAKIRRERAGGSCRARRFAEPGH